jgi:putative tryptophan/tyrosine transport system substrate-binding protein
MTARLVNRLITAFAVALLAPMTGAQPADKIPHIGVLLPTAGPTEQTQIIVRALGELGYVEGENLIIEYRWAAGKNDRLPELAADLVRAKVDLIVTGGTPATLAAKQATPTIPIVFAIANPVEKGIIASLARPGGNLTGIGLISEQLKPLELLKEAAPAVSHVVYLYDPATFTGGFEARSATYRAQAETLGVSLEPVALREPDETEGVFRELPAGTNGLLLENSGINQVARDRICGLAMQRRLPAAGNDPRFASSGCLLSYGEDHADISRREALYVARILKGARPADLPVEQPIKFDLIINLKTANGLGLTVPWTLLLRAEEVIE